MNTIINKNKYTPTTPTQPEKTRTTAMILWGKTYTWCGPSYYYHSIYKCRRRRTSANPNKAEKAVEQLYTS